MAATWASVVPQQPPIRRTLCSRSPGTAAANAAGVASHSGSLGVDARLDQERAGDGRGQPPDQRQDATDARPAVESDHGGTSVHQAPGGVLDGDRAIATGWR